MLKSFIQKFLVIVVLATSLPLSVFAADDFQIEDQPQVIEKVAQLPQKGILKQKDNGYLYVEVSNDFIAEALPLIDVVGRIIPPRHYTSKKGIGAHISVMELRTVKLNKDNKMKNNQDYFRFTMRDNADLILTSALKKVFYNSRKFMIQLLFRFFKFYF